MTKKFSTLLLTGFGGFPGAAQNPTSALIERLRRHRSRFLRQGIRLELAILPVTYDGMPKKLTALHESLKPDAILHFGLASRRRFISLEVRAKNRLSTLHVDASGKCAAGLPVVTGGPAQLAARFPIKQLKADLSRARLKPHLSYDAGDYICNQAFYLSLMSQAAPVAFIHIPKLRRHNIKDLERTALIAIGLCVKIHVKPTN